MAYIVTTKRADGTISRQRKCVQSLNPSISPDAREREIQEGLTSRRKRLKNKKGFTTDKRMRHVCTIPGEVHAEVLRNDGPEAANDPHYLRKRAKELGFNPDTGGGGMRRRR